MSGDYMTAQAHALNHLAIIPDGNTRWAAANNKTAFGGYKLGLQRVVELARHSRKLGIHTLTFWGLSTENWQHRSKAELSFLVRIFERAIDEHVEEARLDGVRIIHLGNKTRLPKRLLKKIAEAEETTRNNKKHILNLALDYGGHDEIVRATRRMLEDTLSGRLEPEELAEQESEDEGKVGYENYLDTAGQPYPSPDYIIRTSGEQRLSGFMPWQAIYAELYFIKDFFPDFTIDKLEEAVKVYATRHRRFGAGH
jgi:undecaprenyl diphosphate synthase